MERLELGMIENAPGFPRRDQRGRYLVVGPDGKMSGYRRVTTVAKLLETERALIPWNGSRYVLGLLRSPKHLAQARKLVKDYGDDPWYAGGKLPFKTLLEKCGDVGGRWERAERGTYLHAVKASTLAGVDPATLELDADAEKWLARLDDALATYGIEIDPNGVERLVVNDTFRIAGTVDYLGVTVPGFELPMIGDLKTGGESAMEFGIRGWAIQVALYWLGEAVYEQGADPNGSADVRGAMPELDQEHALVIHAPADGGEVTFHVVDLDAGRDGVRLALEVEQWRKRTVAEPLCADLTPVLEASLLHVASEEERPSEPNVDGDAAMLEAYRVWLQDRIDVIGRLDAARRELLRRWPEGLAPLRRSDAHTIDELAEIERLADSVEANHSIPFGPNRPGGDERRVLRLLKDVGLTPEA